MVEIILGAFAALGGLLIWALMRISSLKSRAEESEEVVNAVKKINDAKRDAGDGEWRERLRGKGE